jgi:hypothetical protein
LVLPQGEFVTKPKTQEQLDQITSKRLEKRYGRDLAWYENELKLQGGVCKLCGSKPGTRRLHIDHDHKWKYVKVWAEKNSQGTWKAEATYNGVLYVCSGKKRNEAIQEVKNYLKRASVRALLCFRCNSFMVGFNDPDLLRKAAEYLEKHQGAKE